MITISICMIVKNEEAVLARCLDCFDSISDEIIIVDTGSTDGTKSIAAKYTDKIYDYIWKDDFAAARNYAFSKAAMEYVYSADADEVIDEENRQRFLLLKQSLLPEIEIVQMQYANQLLYNTTYNYDTEYRPKLYKRLRDIRWVEPVHEMVDLSPVIYDSDIVVRHMPVSGHAGRDFQIFQKQIAMQGRLSKRLFGMYARELFIAGTDQDFIEAFAYFDTIAGEETYEERERKMCECVLVRCCLIRGDVTGLMKYCLRNIADAKGSSEVCYLLGEYFYQAGDYREAVIWYYNAVYETECELNIHYAGDYPLYKLAQCYRLLGNREQEEAFAGLADAWGIENKG